jgi:exodeoxyribonuclease V gamma subunit
VRFVSHPVRAFLRRRLDVRVGDWDDEIADDLKVELSGLDKWGVGDRLLQARLEGVERRAAILAEIARGELPPGVLGKPVIDEVDPEVERIFTEAQARVEGPAESLDVRVALPDGRMLNGTVAGVHGDVLRSATYSRLGARHRITAWVRLLALSAGHPQRPFTAVTIGRGGLAHIRRVEDPLAALAVVADLYDRGLREPLPLFCKTSAAYAANRADPVAAARREWLSEWNFPREDAEREHAIALGGVLALEDLLLLPPAPDEQWEPLEESRLGQLARRLWDPLLAVEERL